MMDRSIAPTIQPISTIHLLDAEHEVLSNGIQLYKLSGGDQPVVSLQIIVKAGRWHEDKQFQSMLTAKLLKEGTKQKTAKEIAEVIDFYGAHIDISSGYDSTTIHLVSLTKHLQPMLDLLVELLTEPSFSEHELDLQRSIILQKLVVNEQKTDYLAQRKLHEHLFGQNHPYGYSSSIEKYKAIQNKELISFFETQYSINAGFVLLAGELTNDVLKRVKQALSIIHSPDRKADVMRWEIDSQPGQYHISKEHSQQASIRIGQLSMLPNNEDFQSFQLLNTVLGGYFGSRLMSNLREDKGFTYGAYSSVGAFIHQGYFMVHTDVGKEQASSAVQEIYNEIKRLQTEPIPTEELQLVKHYMMGKYLGKIDGPFAQAKLFKSILERGETASHFTERVASIQAISAKQLQAIANKYWQLNKMVEVVIG